MRVSSLVKQQSDKSEKEVNEIKNEETFKTDAERLAMIEKWN